MTPVKNSPWKELKSYQEGDKIFGRDKEISDIYTNIINNLHTIIYGKSGIGKTSILQAGIFPLLRSDNFFPVVIRPSMISDDCSYVDAVIAEVEKCALNSIESLKPSLTIDRSIECVEETDDKLWDYFYRTKFLDANNNVYVPVLIFDQFEEIISNNGTYQKGIELIKSTYTLVDNSKIIPQEYLDYSNFRIVFSFREDYLYAFEDIVDTFNLGEFRFNRFRIRSLTREQTKTIINKTMGQHLEYGDETCEKIIDLVENISNTKMKKTYTPILQIVCSSLYNHMQDNIISDLSIGKTDSFIYDFYNEKISQVSSNARIYLEKELVTSDGRRNSVDMNEAIRIGNISYSEIILLKDLGILSIVKTQSGNERIEFIHDVIPSVVFKNVYQVSIFKSILHAFKKSFDFSGADATHMSDLKGVVIVMFISFITFLFSTLLYTYREDKLLEFIVDVSCFIYILCSLPLPSILIRKAHAYGYSGFQFYRLLKVNISNRIERKIYNGYISNYHCFSPLITIFQKKLKPMCVNDYFAVNFYGLIWALFTHLWQFSFTSLGPLIFYNICFALFFTRSIYCRYSYIVNNATKVWQELLIFLLHISIVVLSGYYCFSNILFVIQLSILLFGFLPFKIRKRS